MREEPRTVFCFVFGGLGALGQALGQLRKPQFVAASGARPVATIHGSASGSVTPKDLIGEGNDLTSLEVPLPGHGYVAK